MIADAQTKLILASTSPYRRELLQRLQIPFDQVSPDFKELPPGSMPVRELVLHNTTGKARAVFNRHPDAMVIGSDQLAVCGERVLGKPLTVEAACSQLAELSGKRVSFLTGVALISREQERCDVICFDVEFRILSDDEIVNYVRRELPLDCAGSFKSEGLGITLFRRMSGDDPTALIGLPLIRLSDWLKPLKQAPQ